MSTGCGVSIHNGFVLLAGTHRFDNLLHKNRHQEGSDYFNRTGISAFSIAGMAVYTGVAAVTGVFPGTHWGCCQHRI